MDWYRKIQFYKSLLIGFWSINIVLICVTLVASFRYFQYNKILEESQQQQKQIMNLLSVESELAKLSIMPQQGEEHSYELRKKIDELKKLINAIADIPSELKEYASSPKWKLGPTENVALRRSILEAAEKQIAVSQKDVDRSSRTTKELLFLGIFTLLFGIVLPFVVFAFLTKTLLKAKQSLEEKMSTWMAEVMQKIPRDHSNPWSNPLLWLEIILTTCEIFAPASRHPALLVLKDLMPVMKAEFAKAKNKEPA